LIEFPPPLAAEVEAFAKGRGETFKSVVLAALRRHLDNPPPLPTMPPLPPVVVDKPAPAKKSAKSKDK